MSLALLAASALTPSRAVEIRRTDLGHGLYLLEGPGGNIAVSTGADGVVLIDDQFARVTDAIEGSVREVSDQPIRFLLNTHWHHDHTGGNENLGKAGAVIVAHHNVRKRLAAGGLMEAFGREAEPAPKAALPVVSFDDDIRLHLNGLTLDARHVAAAHTDGDAFVWFPEANVLHTGDLYFNGFYPVIDWGSGGHIEGVIAALDRMLPLINDNTRVIPGHGPLSDRAGLVEYRELLATVAARIGPMVAAGKSLDQVKASQPTAEFDARWGNGYLKIEPWIEQVYEGMRRQAAATPGDRAH